MATYLYSHYMRLSTSVTTLILAYFLQIGGTMAFIFTDLRYYLSIKKVLSCYWYFTN